MSNFFESLSFAAIMALRDEIRERNQVAQQMVNSIENQERSRRIDNKARRMVISEYKQEAINILYRIFLRSNELFPEDPIDLDFAAQLVDMVLETTAVECIRAQCASMAMQVNALERIVDVGNLRFICTEEGAQTIYSNYGEFKNLYLPNYERCMQVVAQQSVITEAHEQSLEFFTNLCHVFYGFEQVLNAEDEDERWPGKIMGLYCLNCYIKVTQALADEQWQQMTPEEQKEADYDKWLKENS